jgi:hypothetical protein
MNAVDFDNVAAQERLRQWLPVPLFEAEVDGIDQAVGDAAIEAAGFGYFRDAWIGLACAKATGATRARLGADPPDVELAYADGSERSLEVVEVVRSGRRRGDEICEDRAKAAAGLPTVRHEPGETWASASEVLQALATRVEAKARKGYPPETVLAVYLNVGDWDNERKQIEAGMAGALGVALRAFSAVWILWHGRLYLADATNGVRLAKD